MIEQTSNLASLTEESAWRTPHMTKTIPKKGDIMQVGKSKIIVTEARDGRIYSFKRLQTAFIAFDPDEDIPTRQKLIRDKMKDQLPIELIDVTLRIDGLEVGYGYDTDLEKAYSITIIYTK